MKRGEGNLRDLSCRLRCSLLLKARLQNWHLYFFSGASDDDDDDLRMADDEAAGGRTVMFATGILVAVVGVLSRVFDILFLVLFSFLHRPMVEIVWRASVGVGLKG